MARLRMVSADHLRQGLASASRQVRDDLGWEILEEANTLAPSRTGTLRGTGFVESDDELTRVGYDVFYSRFVELGTIHQRATPFLRPAALKKRGTIR